MERQYPAPSGALLREGMREIKRRFDNPAKEVRIAALLEALKYGGEGIDFLIEALEDRECAIQWTAYRLLKERPEEKVKERIEKWLPKFAFEFEAVKVNRQGEVIQTERGKAGYFREDLGNGVSLDMVYIPGGTYLMGAPKGEAESSRRERPQHKVTVPSFFMGKYQITQAQWREVASLPKIKENLASDPSRFKGENRPVEQVSWYAAKEFCQGLADKTGRKYRLPSEAEWEYACRAGTRTPFYFGETLTPDLANYEGNYTYGDGPKGEYRKSTTPVGSFPPNKFGLYDMHGNVWEWCEDDYHDNYEGAPEDGTAWVKSNNPQSSKMLRGGSWDLNPRVCRSADRNWISRDLRYFYTGFRVAVSLPG